MLRSQRIPPLPPGVKLFSVTCVAGFSHLRSPCAQLKGVARKNRRLHLLAVRGGEHPVFINERATAFLPNCDILRVDEGHPRPLGSIGDDVAVVNTDEEARQVAVDARRQLSD